MPPAPDFEQAVRASFARQGLMRLLDAEIGSLEPGACELRVRFRDDLTQQHGFFHAGVVGALADNACGYAAYTVAPAGSSVLTVEYKLNLLEPGVGDELVVRARVLRAGRRLVVCAADAFVLDDAGTETHCATSLQTVRVFDRSPAGEPG